VSSPFRTVAIDPFLMEVNATEAAVEPLSLDAPEVRELESKYADRDWEHPFTVENDQLRVKFAAAGATEASRVNWKNQNQVLAAVTKEEFRLPTLNEFEHACRAGSRTLFRWGDESPEEEPGHTGCGTPDCQPSAFGLNIAQNPYKFEFVMEPNLMCGGDGGRAICCGIGVFISWLTLSSSFTCRSWGAHPMPNAHFRRVFPLNTLLAG
jgi:hypothetical protein